MEQNSSAAMIELRSGDSQLQILPKVGGAIGRFAAGAGTFFPPRPCGLGTPLECGGFPLAPYRSGFD
jgi:hypothetical protein